MLKKLMSITTQKTGELIDKTGLVLIGVFSVLYSIFWSYFAEIHVNLPFLDFPVFVGEILLFICLTLLFLKWKIEKFKFNKWYLWLVVFAVWIIVRAVHGYVTFSALALRNAAMFYYAFFAVITFHLLRKEYFKPKEVAFLLALLLIIKAADVIKDYFYFPYLMLTLLLLLTFKSRWIKAALFIIVLIFYPFKTFFVGSRSFLIGNTCAFSYLFFCSIFFVLKIKKRVRFLIFAGLLAFLVLSFSKLASKNQIKSLTTPHNILLEFVEKERVRLVRQKTFEPLELRVKLYNPNKTDPRYDNYQTPEKDITIAQITRGGEQKTQVSLKGGKEDGLLEELSKCLDASTELKDGELFIDGNLTYEGIDARIKKDKKCWKSKKRINEPLKKYVYVPGVSPKQPRQLSVEYSNILFRIFIWRDMLKEFMEYKPLFGFNLGRPQRSISLEVLNQGYGEWSRDGWITPHSYFLHVLYRGGIVGLVLLGVMIFTLFDLTKTFIQMRSLRGLLLTSILVYWTVVAQFLVVLELPYQAIPFWSIWGMTMAYRKMICKGAKDQ